MLIAFIIILAVVFVAAYAEFRRHKIAVLAQLTKLKTKTTEDAGAIKVTLEADTSQFREELSKAQAALNEFKELDKL